MRLHRLKNSKGKILKERPTQEIKKLIEKRAELAGKRKEANLQKQTDQKENQRRHQYSRRRNH